MSTATDDPVARERRKGTPVEASTPGSEARGRPRWRRVATLALRAIGTVGLMSLALRGIDWYALRDVLGGVDWRWWAAGLAILVAVQFVAALRWALLARPVGFDLPLAVFIRRYLEGLFFNLVLPTSIGGDVVKAYRLSDTVSGRILAACTVLADRVAGLTALAVIALTAWGARRYSLALVPSILTGAALASAVFLASTAVVGNLGRIASMLPPVAPLHAAFARLLPYQKRPGLVTSAIGWGLVVQIGGVLSVACVGRALGVDVDLPTWFMVVPLVNLMMVLPISIGGVGVREGMLSVLLAPSGVPKETAVAVGLLALLTTVVCGLLGGIVFLADERRSMPTT